MTVEKTSPAFILRNRDTLREVALCQSVKMKTEDNISEVEDKSDGASLSLSRMDTTLESEYFPASNLPYDKANDDTYANSSQPLSVSEVAMVNPENKDVKQHKLTGEEEPEKTDNVDSPSPLNDTLSLNSMSEMANCDNASAQLDESIKMLVEVEKDKEEEVDSAFAESNVDSTSKLNEECEQAEVLEPELAEDCEEQDSQLLVSSQSEKEDTKSVESKLHEEERSQNHIEYLVQHLPELASNFDIHKKIGEGTFSSVFLGTLRKEIWSLFPQLKDRQFAIKHLVPNILPARIAKELRFLQEIGGRENVVGVDLCFRKSDCVVFVMPYLSHKRFSEYVLDMDVAETRDYMRNLMIALRHVHSFNVIHRDVKPSNFLYNREEKKFLLVDFGLSQRLPPPPPSSGSNKANEEKARKRKRQEDVYSETLKENGSQYKSFLEDSRAKRSVLKSLSRNEQNIMPTLVHSQGSVQPLKRRKLDIMDNSTATSQTPCTPKTRSCKASSSQKRKTPRSSPKISRDSNIRKKLFVSNNENEVVKPAAKKKTEGTFSSVFASASSARALQILQPISSTPKKNQNGNPLMTPLPSSNASQSPFSFQSPPAPQSGSANKFQSLAPPKDRKDSSGGATLVRVQNSQVKSQTPRMLSPLESEQQRKMLQNSAKARFVGRRVGQPCVCFGLARVCNVCQLRKIPPAPRAGTPGFRPPEVLLKYPMQTTAVDMWAAGVIFLCILSGCYPFFRCPDDISALAEIMTIFGTDNIKNVARRLGRLVQCSQQRPPLDLFKLCERLRRRRLDIVNGRPESVDSLPLCPECENTIDEAHDGCLCLKPGASAARHAKGQFPASAYDLLEKLLDLNPVTRITAEEALHHPFITGK